MAQRKLTGKDYLKKAVKYFLEEDGATEMGSYKDAVTEILHLAFSDKKLRKNWIKPDRGARNNPNWDATLKDHLLWSAYEVFEEEREEAELRFLNSINKKDLPLHIDHPWEFVKREFEERLKNA